MTLPRVDFYVMKQPGPDARGHTTCRLAERAWKAGHTVLIRIPDANTADRIDDLLWTFRQDAFVPHAKLNGGDPPREPVLIGIADAPTAGADVLINLGEDVPLGFADFARVAEVISGDDTVKAQGRERYRFYRDQGCEVNTHNV
ncbi:MAG: DNA polymerase III subunit chi [Pseudomonadota bacterium]